MKIVNGDFVKGKKVLLRYDIDVALECKVQSLGSARDKSAKCKVKEDFKLRAGLETVRLCLENASKVIIVGHLGRPFGNLSELSARPIQVWFEQNLGLSVDFAESLEQAAQSISKIVLLENVRFFHGEVEGDIDFARQLAALGDVYVNEAFSSHNKGASTTIVPTLLPHATGLHFAEEVRILREVRDNPKKPFVVIMGGAKVKDKLPVILSLAKNADTVLVGGKIASEITLTSTAVERNVMVGKLNEAGTDLAAETVDLWRSWIVQAATIVWNGPLGKFEDPRNDQTKKIAQAVLDSGAEVVIGGGDTVAALSQYGLLEKAEEKAFVSVGGGAMLKFLAEGTLPTIAVLN